MSDCIFCEIAQGKARAKIVLETDKFVVFENINPQAPVHVLVVPRDHFEKRDTIKGGVGNFWDEIMEVVYQVIVKYELDKTGYRLVNNGAGYNGLEHEHVHVLGGQNWRPQDDL